MKRDLKVGFVAGTLGRGGAERQLLYALRALTGTAVTACVFTPTRGEAYEEAIRALGVEVIHIGAGRGRMQRLRDLAREARRRRVDILQSFHFYMNLYVALAARTAGAVEIGAIRSDLSRELQRGFLLGGAQLKAPRHLVANSEAGRATAIASGIRPERITLIRNAVDLDAFRPGAREATSPAMLLAIGRLIQEKRIDRFVRLVARLIDSGHDVWGIVLGDGPKRSELESLAVRERVSERVRFAGEQEDVASFLRGADILVSTSETEGSPNALLEAMAAGVPIVAMRAGGVAELVTAERGILVPSDDEVALARAVEGLVVDPARRRALADEASAYVRRRHSISVLGKELLALYEEVAVQRRG